MKSLVYPIYIVGKDLDVCVPIFCKAIQANGDNNDVDIINLSCFTFHDAISKLEEFFFRTHLVRKFEKLKVAFCKHY